MEHHLLSTWCNTTTNADWAFRMGSREQVEATIRRNDQEKEERMDMNGQK